MVITLLGGSGFIGLHLSNALVRIGHQVRILSRHPDAHPSIRILPNTRIIATPTLDSQTLVNQLRGSDAVINLVGILNERGDNGHGFYAAHVLTTQRIIDASLELGIKRLLHMSALGADPAQGTSFYQRSKGQAQKLVERTSLETTIFRPSVVFGPGDSFFNRFADLLRQIPALFPLACPASQFAPVFVSDVVKAFIGALNDRQTINQTYDLCGPRIYSLAQLVAYTAVQIGLERRILGLPHWAGRLQANLLEYAPGKPFSRDNWRSLQADNICVENGLMRLGIVATPVESVVPLYLGSQRRQEKYGRLRTQARQS